jgi:MFS family permease
VARHPEPPAFEPVPAAEAEREPGSAAVPEPGHGDGGAGGGVSSALPAGAGRFASLAPLRRRNYALLWSGGLVSNIGSWMQTVAVGALVIAHTGKATWAVVIAAGAFLPIGVLAPVGGALADRIPRRAALVTGNLVAGVVALVIALLVAAGRDGPGVLTLLVTAQGCVSALISPFQQAILPDLVPRPEFLPAVSLNSAQYNLGRVIGPALAGATVAAFGYPIAFVANAVSFLAVVIALAFIRLAPPPGRDERLGLAASLRLGFEAARGEPGCRAAIGMIAVVGLLASPFIALVPAMAHRLSHSGARGVASATGILTTAQGVGAVLGALAVTPLARRFSRGRVLFVSLLLLPPALGLYAFSPTLLFGFASLFLVGLIYIGVLSGLSTVVQLRAPTEYRGRVLSFYLVALGVSYPIGSLLQGPIADQVGLAWTTLGAAALLAATLVTLRMTRPGVFRVLAATPPISAG